MISFKLSFLAFILSFSGISAFSSGSRRAFMNKVGGASAATFGFATATVPLIESANAAPEILKTASGIKYAVTKETDKKNFPQSGDIVAIEYTGYLSNGQIFDATHSEGKKNALLFKLGSTAVISGLNEMVSYMAVGERVQAIIPPELAFGDEGICLENGECLIKPGSTLVYDVSLKKSSIPPP
mmetsp:Transcript_15325/g.18653  ORF Transcript_15325/g.18653 Transcript_15325/m.18653 type:complete len:184 (-) Transcript_15325:210-761(-)